MSLTADLGKIRGRSLSELSLLFQVFFLLGIFRYLIAILPFQKITRLLGLIAAPALPGCEADNSPFLSRLAWAVSAAVRRTPWHSACLAQSLTASLLLKNKRIPFLLYLGMAKDDLAGQYSAHSWLRCGEKIITGANGHKRYNIVASFKAAGE
ncbi:MAG: lasso peptide biosynthesis B2 protein [Chloroflexota bacterium]